MRINLASAIEASTSSYVNYLPPSSLQSAVFISTDPIEIFNTVNGLSNTKSFGIDKISSLIIKLCANIISVPFTCLLNNALQYGYFPSEFKIAKIIPLYKSGHNNLVSNYRPISLLTNFS